MKTYNTLGRYFKIDINRTNLGLFTYACICVEINITKGLLDNFILQKKGSKWVEQMDFENIAL